MSRMRNSSEISIPEVFAGKFRASMRCFAVVCLVTNLALMPACKNRAEQSPADAMPNGKETAHANDMATGVVPHSHSNTPTAANATPVDTQIVGVQLSNKGDERSLTGSVTNEFEPSSAGVFMSIRTQGTASNYTLSSKWLTPSGEILTEYSQAINAPGPVETIFSLSKPDGWTKGQYRVELAINGKPMQTASFTIR